MNKICIGTRKSKLALWQTNHVSALLAARYPDLGIEQDHIVTQGDIILDRPLAAIGDKGLFTQELEDRLLDGRIHMAVHSLKDLPTVLPDGLTIGAILPREVPEDVLISRAGQSLKELPAGAKVGTSSVRRIAQLKRHRSDLEILDIRGNVDTRLKKLDDGEYDAILLARAGLVRLGLSDRITEVLTSPNWYHAVSQGALAIEIDAGNQDVINLLKPLICQNTHAQAIAERAFLRILEGGCQVPVGVYTSIDNGQLILHGMVAGLDGTPFIKGVQSGAISDAVTIGEELAEQLIGDGAKQILDSINESQR